MVLKRLAIFGMLAMILSGWGMSLSIGAQVPAPPSGSPAVFFPEKIFEFAPVIEGASVAHDFIVANKGNAPLLINNVRTG
jgi:hypothetical protein